MVNQQSLSNWIAQNGSGQVAKVSHFSLIFVHEKVA